MCKAAPQLRCENHANENITKAKKAVARWKGEVALLGEMGSPVPERLSKALLKAEFVLEAKEQERLELLFHQYTRAVVEVAAVARGLNPADDYTKKAQQIVTEVEKLTKANPSYASILRSNSETRVNAGAYINTGALPTGNRQIVEMMELLNTTRTTRDKDQSGRWKTTPAPLTTEERRIRDTAAKQLAQGVNESKPVQAARKDAPVPACPAVTTAPAVRTKTQLPTSPAPTKRTVRPAPAKLGAVPQKLPPVKRAVRSQQPANVSPPAAAPVPPKQEPRAAEEAAERQHREERLALIERQARAKNAATTPPLTDAGPSSQRGKKVNAKPAKAAPQPQGSHRPKKAKPVVKAATIPRRFLPGRR